MGILNKLPVFKKFLFCIPLRIGVTVVGYWYILVLLASIGFNIYLMANMTVESSGGSKLMARAYMLRTINIIIHVVYVVLSVMLLIGAHKKKPEYLRHFFVSSLVMTKVHVVCLAVGFFYNQRHWLLFVYGWFYHFVQITSTNVYLLLIVRSSFLAMEEKERGPKPKRCEPDEEVCWDTMQLAHVV